MQFHFDQGTSPLLTRFPADNLWELQAHSLQPFVLSFLEVLGARSPPPRISE